MNVITHMTSSPTTFIPLSPEKEFALLRGDNRDFGAVIQYVTPLIDAVLSRLNVRPPRASDVRKRLIDEVPVAARRYLDRALSRKTSYRFSTYFTWYIKQRIEATQG